MYIFSVYAQKLWLIQENIRWQLWTRKIFFLYLKVLGMYVVLHFLKPTITNAIVLLLADISWGNIRKIIIKTRKWLRMHVDPGYFKLIKGATDEDNIVKVSIYKDISLLTYNCIFNIYSYNPIIKRILENKIVLKNRIYNNAYKLYLWINI